MMGSMDMIENIIRLATTNMVITGFLSGIALHAWTGAGFTAPAARLGRGASFMRKTVARNVRKIIAPARKKVLRMPTNGGSTQPINGPARFPAMMPDESMPKAQPERDFGVWTATRIVAPRHNRPATRPG